MLDSVLQTLRDQLVTEAEKIPRVYGTGEDEQKRFLASMERIAAVQERIAVQIQILRIEGEAIPVLGTMAGRFTAATEANLEEILSDDGDPDTPSV